jgi:hypothetical protein
MKTIRYVLAISLFTFAFYLPPGYAQSNELIQLILNVEKLEQLKSILDRMKDGYDVLSKGYQAVQDVSKGNFTLHKVFLDKLLEVSPLVRNYAKVVQIAAMQKNILSEYKGTLNTVRHMNVFNGSDLQYLEEVYKNLTDRTARSLDELILVITAGQLRMNDAERMAFIDRIHLDVTGQLQFLRYFNNQAIILGKQKQQGLEEATRLQALFDRR